MSKELTKEAAQSVYDYCEWALSLCVYPANIKEIKDRQDRMMKIIKGK